MTPMLRLRLPAPMAILTGAILLAALPAGLRAQVASVALVDAGRPVPVEITPEATAMGRALAHGLLASARQDVTRPISDAELDALGTRGTLLRVRLSRSEDVLLLRLRARARASRLAAYVPPDRDDQAYVFLGRSGWERIVVVSLPDTVRQEIRALRAAGP